MCRRQWSTYPKQRHAFMGLLTCAKCGCAITAERKKGKYVYYHCTDHHGECDNSYIREERLADLLGDVITPIQISPDIAEEIATALRATDREAEERRCRGLRELEQRRRAVLAKLDRGYDDFVDGRISADFWARKAEEWEAEVSAIDADRVPRAAAAAGNRDSSRKF
jgi:site-specific DNA recombinase